MNLTSKQAQLAKLRPLSPEAVRSLSEAWEVQMIYESNAIEGNSLTLRETEVVLSKGVTVSGKPLKDHLETVNLSKAWSRLGEMAQPNSSFTVVSLLELHEIVMSGVDEKSGGSFRDGAVRIKGSSHVPPNAAKVSLLVDELVKEANSLDDPIARAARLHHGLANIHPFYDGNGRVARLAMNFSLMAGGFPPVSISQEQRHSYYEALEAADRGESQTWTAFLSRLVEDELNRWLAALGETISQN